MGIIGFEGPRDYGAVGAVTNLAARLCAEAKAGQTLVEQGILASIESVVDTESLGEVALKGFANAVSVFNITRLRKWWLDR